MEYSNFKSPTSTRSFARGDDSFASAPQWARRFIDEFRRLASAGFSTTHLRPASFGAPRTRESRSALIHFVDQRAADGSSLTKVPQHARDLVARWTAETRQSASAAIARRRQLLLNALS